VTYPDDATMNVLHALTCGVEVSFFEDDGELAVRVPAADSPTGWRWVRIPLSAQEELVERGWLNLVGEDELEVTDQGVYWVRKWVNGRAKAARKRRAV
jgi:hypothetical protein